MKKGGKVNIAATGLCVCVYVGGGGGYLNEENKQISDLILII